MHTLVDPDLLAELSQDLAPAERLQRLVGQLRTRFRCGAVVLLRLEESFLRPVAIDGLVGEALGRRFAVHQHPRLAALLAQREVLCFDKDSQLPDPYDGLLDALPGAPLPVHDCMGVALWLDARPWGVLTLDALRTGTFGAAERSALARYALLVQAAVRMAQRDGEIHQLRLAPTAAAHSADAQAQTQALALAGEAEIVGQSPALSQLLHELRVVAQSQLPVLLLGETGVGKELFARWLHRHSPRAAQPLVQVNCAALPESLAESELFGHVRGAFSGALTERPGRFEAADGGTLLLDEVGELPLAVQAKLLRTLQNGEIQRLGADQPRHVDVRIIAATNRRLREQVAAGSFRADLYHRLSVYPVPIPPLRERGNDVLLLAGRFLELNRARLGLRSLRLAPAAQEALLRYRWPGNVRELEHVISRAALKALSQGAHPGDIVTLEPAWLDLDTGPSNPSSTTSATNPTHSASPAAPAPRLHEAVQACQRQHIHAALAQHQGNWAQAARSLGLDASNLHKLAKRLGLKETLSKQ